MRARCVPGGRAGGALAAEAGAALLGPASACCFELLNPLGTGEAVQPKETRFPGIPGPEAVAGPGTEGNWGPGGKLVREVV